MMNMSYCRFHNTANDLRDCLDALNDWSEMLSEEEAKSGKRMFKDFLRFCAENDIIKDFNEEGIEEVFDNKL